jgi:hypothetical protein
VREIWIPLKFALVFYANIQELNQRKKKGVFLPSNTPSGLLENLSILNSSIERQGVKNE